MFTIEEAFNFVTNKLAIPCDKKYIHDLGDRWAFHYDGSLGECDDSPSPITFNKSTGEIKYCFYPEIADELNKAKIVELPS